MIHNREDLLAALAHDLKSPLLSATRILEFLVAGEIPPERQQAVFSQMLESHREMLRLIWNLLDVYRNDAGRLTPVSEEIDVGNLVSQCVDQFSFAISEKKIDVHLLVEGTPIVRSDSLLLKRILTNLLSNAVKFSHDSGIITIRSCCSNDRCNTSVQDNGPGMNEQEKSGIFKRFWQTERSRETGSGTGLGLAISKEMAHLLGGDLVFESEVGIGTTFTLSVPVKPQNMLHR